MRIGELAKEVKCTTETIRFYEKIGLLMEANRSENNYRTYGPKHLEHLKLIRNCRSLDMSHEEIRVLLNLYENPDKGCGEANIVLEEHLGHINQRIAELIQLRDQLIQIRLQCQSDNVAGDCGILQGLAELELEQKPNKNTHL